MTEISPEKIQQIQALEQTLQTYSQQKNQFQAQSMEVNSALEELEKTETAYKIVGNIMVAASKEDLKKELEEKKSLLEVRLKSALKQEAKTKEEYQAIQKEIMESMKNAKK